ncbi:response regulator transcription factor [Pseudoduganella umbonata]|uniref:DNA-binding response OmpR family regulator n=1 Tax=Pseudoduganella umbonata TaxID=864828 RepID=A0A4P8HT39_9BURK|nr:DNA-binding response regulator [Pseudoduganella umbonata]MBB3222972.1 DNA-binding response OmpR family regulator [Pseudoduganella umbonata]QCP13087.1 response regulator transcription factor [Pseudoduganella umbonata]
MYLTTDATVRNILIVDDSAFEQRLLADLLSEMPYRVCVAFNGAEGYRLALTRHPDLILLDVRMPDMDGYTCCRLLKANPATQHIPVIFVSGTESAEERILGLSIGGVDFVSKPFMPAELAARIHVHLNLVPRQEPASAPAPAPLLALAAAPAETDAVTVRAAMRLIQDNLGALPRLAEIARNVGTYREKLSALFREQTGKTVFAFVREERLARGMQLLRETDFDVQHIAQLLGFRSAANFATAFRARTGTTPGAYRLAMLDKAGN